MRLPAIAALWLLLAAFPAAATTRMVILPILVHTSAPDPAYVSSGIADMLSARLEQAGFSIERVDDADSATTRLGDALRLGQKAGGDYVLFGAFTQFGDGASLDVHCLPLNVKSEAEAARQRRIFIQSGAVGEIIPKIDEIVDRVAVYVKAHASGQLVAQDGAPAATGTTAAAPTAAGASAAVDPDKVQELIERIEGLEEAVFGGGGGGASDAAPAPGSAAQIADPPPES